MRKPVLHFFIAGLVIISLLFILLQTIENGNLKNERNQLLLKNDSLHIEILKARKINIIFSNRIDSFLNNKNNK